MLVPLFTLIAAFTVTLTFFDDTPFINQLIGKQADVNQTYKTERVYISTDKAHYVPGETIYLSAFIRDGNTLTPSDMSKVIHVEIEDEFGIKRLKRSFYLKDAPTASVDLPESLAMGTYQLKAYTTWQRNDVHTLVFSKEIYVQNFRNKNDAPVKVGKQAIVKFYPEGGDLVNGLPTNVAFSAVDENDNPIAFSGILTGSMGTNVKIITTNNGMGKFSLIPVKGEVYTITYTGKHVINLATSFPEVKEEGYVINLKQNTNEGITLAVNTTRSITSTITLKVRDELLYGKQHVLKAGSNEITIPTAEFPQGVAQVTLFDGNDIEQAERLVFINKHKKLNIEIIPRKSTYLPNDSVKATIKVTDNTGKPVKGTFSLSVIDDALHQVEEGKGSDIMSKLLLEPDLKGKIKDAAYYLSDKEGADDALDLLCMTRGWRRFEWKEVRSFQPSIMIHEYETNRVKGVLVDHRNRNPLPGKVVKLYISGDSLVKAKSWTNERGEFSFDNLIDFKPEMGMKLLVTINGVLHTYDLDYYASSLVANERGLNDINATYGLGFGKVEGKLINEETNQPMSGVRLELKRRDEYGSKYITTAVDGSFSFANVNYGTYQLYVPIEGKSRPKKLEFAMVNKSCYMEVAVDERKPELASIRFSLPEKEELGSSVFAYSRKESIPTNFVERGPRITPPCYDCNDFGQGPPVVDGRPIILMINQQKIGTGTIKDRTDLWVSSAKSTEKRAETTSGVYRSPNGGLSIRGSRTDGTALIVDGVRMPIGTVIPTAGTESFEVLTGGIPAKYGDFTGGAIMITTASTGTVGFDGWVDTALMPVEYARVRDFGEEDMDDFEEEKKEKVDLFTNYHPTTVYWDGNVTTDEKGLAEITFANADFEGNFAIMVEGASVNGLLGKGVNKFTSLNRMSITIGKYEVKDGKLSVKVKVKNNTDLGLSTAFTFVYPPELVLISPDPSVSYIKKKQQIEWDDEVYDLNKYIKNITLDPNGELEFDFVYEINDAILSSFFAAEVSNGNNRITKTTLLPHITK